MNMATAPIKEQQALLKTPLWAWHQKYGARMVPFAGYDLPVQYEAGVKAEHMQVREKAGLFDVSHMGEFWVKGPKALEFIQKVTSNDASVLSIGKAQYSCFPNGKGGIGITAGSWFNKINPYLSQTNRIIQLKNNHYEMRSINCGNFHPRNISVMLRQKEFNRRTRSCTAGCGDYSTI